FANTHGSFSFNGVHSNDPVADYLLGLDNSFFQDTSGPEGYYRYRQFETYFQDDWKVKRNLSLNLGLRLVYYSSDSINNLPWSDFDPRKWDSSKAPVVQSNGLFVQDSNGSPLTSNGQVADLLNGVVIAGQNGVPKGVYNTSP